jgi:hypothetical protein
MIKVRRIETVAYTGQLDRSEAIALLTERPDGTPDPARIADLAAMSEDQLKQELIQELQRFGPTSDGFYESIERHNTVVSDAWELC